MKFDQPIRRLGERCLLISVVWRPPSAAALPLINIPNLCYNGNIKPTDCVDSNCLLSKCSLAKRSCLGCQSVKLSCWLFPRSTSWSGGSERERAVTLPESHHPPSAQNILQTVGWFEFLVLVLSCPDMSFLRVSYLNVAGLQDLVSGVKV